MKNPIYKILFIALLSLGILSPAQKVDATAKTILDAVSKNYKSKKNIYFKFVYQTGNKQITKRETGIFYSTPTQYKLRIMDIEQLFDGKKIYSISHDDKEVTIAKPNDGDTLFSPINYIDQYQKGYHVSFVGKRTLNGVSTDLIKLVPSQKGSIKEVLIYINSAKKQLVKLEQHSTNNNIAIITINQYKENQVLDSALFSFNKNSFKDYLITEL